MTNTFEFAQQQSGRQPRPSRSFMRIMIWLLVTGWCMIPFFWAGGMLVTSLMDASATKTKDKDKKPRPTPDWPSSPAPESPTAVSPLYAILSSSIMFMLFAYALWCAAGVLCGLGMDRAWSALAGTA